MSEKHPSLVDWDSEKRPNTFVVGAPKCGTTALCHYLDQHPDVFMSSPKEPHYFVGKEMPRKARVFAETERYARLFLDVAGNQKTIAEGSVWYLYSQTALQNISQFNPESKIIVMLRRPDEMVYSMHNQAVGNFSEDIIDFNEAWKTAIGGNHRSSWSPLCDEHSKLDYHRIALFSKQLERLFRYFPKNQVHIIFYDDFKQRTRESFDEVLLFLGLESVDVNTRKVNESQVVVNRTVGRFLTKPPPFAMEMSRQVKKLLGVEKLGMRKWLRTFNNRVQSRSPIDPLIRAEIISYYREDIIKLGKMCDRDLSHWLR
ncbi:MAG: hypothetical protein ACJA0Z_000242 [Halioglobus sp.]|jgi:hypothetical protein